MTTAHPAKPTQPLVAGAPLPKDILITAVNPVDVASELSRAEVELLYACGRHRKAWAAMRARAEDRDEIASSGIVGRLPELEADAIWKKRTGDVKWWAAEMTAQATVVTALQGIMDRMPRVSRS